MSSGIPRLMDMDIPRPQLLDNNTRGSFQVDAGQLIELINECLRKFTQQQGRPSTTRSSGRAAPPPSTAPPRRPTETRSGDDFHSSNQDFVGLVRGTVAIAKILHSSSNWTKFPPSLDSSLGNFESSIHPPQPSVRLRQELRSATDDYRRRIREVVLNHNSSTLDAIVKQVHHLNQQDIDQAHVIARRQLKRLFGSRMSVATIDEACRRSRKSDDGATSRMPSHPAGPSSPSSRPSEWPTLTTANRFEALASDDLENSAMDTRPTDDSLDRQGDRPTRRRHHSSGSSGPASKRLPPKSSASEVVEPPAAVQSTRPPPTVQQVVNTAVSAPSLGHTSSQTDQRDGCPSSSPAPTRHPTDPAKTAVSLPKIYRRNSYDVWNIGLKTVPASSNVVVLADSNASRWKNFPSNWTVIVRPGANLEELASVFGRCHLHAGVKMVIIAVGIKIAVQTI